MRQSWSGLAGKPGTAFPTKTSTEPKRCHGESVGPTGQEAALHTWVELLVFLVLRGF